MTRDLHGDLVVSRGHLVSDISILVRGFFKNKMMAMEMAKVALWKPLHTDSQSLSVANCIQAGGLICSLGPPDWGVGLAFQAGARPVCPWDKCLFFLVAVFRAGLPCLLLTSQAEGLWPCRAKVGHAGRLGAAEDDGHRGFP